MNRRLEDEIAKMVFGDVSPERAAEIERLAETDPAARKVLAQYRAMREGLRAMSPALDHQLSSERLREEILRRGLEPKRGGWDWRWLSVPLAAAGALTFAMWWNQGTASAPVIVLGPSEAGSVAQSVPDLAPDLPATLARPDSPNDDRSAESRETASSVVPAPAPRPAPRGRAKEREKPRLVADKGVESKLEPAKVAMRAAEAETSVAPTVPAAFSNPSGMGGAVADLAAPGARQGDSEAIVVIQPVRDANTGAYRATEVASPSNVLIGS